MVQTRVQSGYRDEPLEVLKGYSKALKGILDLLNQNPIKSSISNPENIKLMTTIKTLKSQIDNEITNRSQPPNSKSLYRDG